MNLSELSALLSVTSIGTLLVAIFSYKFMNASFGPWFDVLERIRNRKIQHPQTFLNEAEEVSLETQILLRDVSEARMLQRTIGIYAERKMRGALLRLHLDTSHEVDFRTIRLAWPYLELKEGKLHVVKVGGLRKAWRLGNLLFAAFILALLAVCLCAALYLIVVEPFEQAYLYATIFGFYTVSLIVMLQAPGLEIRAWLAARRIGRDLAEGFGPSRAVNGSGNEDEAEGSTHRTTGKTTTESTRID